ncbi:molybdopterin adenylyltransferase [Pseudaminobacter arsenicus]|uniref:Molybdopterin adenylyltransferase n=1 Tax=Borborobacter arsenicus TaxID=1851146 RepID=A0A432UZ17_9HYPH|nr:molybdopterin adenylyltransferase [Pseudaminobacter arsenicus]RUM95184.1 molybdopterin adenylyltransferase [Pseudaminobacter arsenicus]
MVHIAIVTISDRASRSAYEDLGGPAVEEWLRRAIVTPCSYTRRTIPDGLEVVRDVLIDLCDRTGVELIMTTGGSGPSPRDLTPEAMRAVVTKELPGFGELMRRISLEQVPTAILSRQTAGIRGRSLIVNLPGRPASINTCLNAIFPAVPYCLDLIGAGGIITDPAICASHRPETPSPRQPHPQK